MNSPNKPKPDVDKKTAKGEGEGGFAPHPETPGPPERFDPHSYVKPSKGNDAKQPKDNSQPVHSRPPTKGTGHESAKGGLPEKQPRTKEQ
jgi:hypothetical protein